MINLILMFIFAVLFFVFFCALKHTKLNAIIGWVFALLFVIAVVMGIANEKFHYGMTKETTTTTTNIVSSVPKVPVLLYQPLDKNGKETIYLYRKSETDKKPTPTEADIDVKNKVIKEGKTAKLVQKTTTWTYKNNVIAFFFKYPSKEQEVVSVENDFYIPSSWKVMTSDELKEMRHDMVMKAKMAKQKQAASHKK